MIGAGAGHGDGPGGGGGGPHQVTIRPPKTVRLNKNRIKGRRSPRGPAVGVIDVVIIVQVVSLGPREADGGCGH